MYNTSITVSCLDNGFQVNLHSYDYKKNKTVEQKNVVFTNRAELLEWLSDNIV